MGSAIDTIFYLILIWGAILALMFIWNEYRQRRKKK